MTTLRIALPFTALTLCSILGSAGCGDSAVEPAPAAEVRATSAEIGPEGGALIAPEDGPFAGFKLVIPGGALSQKVKVSFTGVFDETPLPDTAERVGPQVRIEPAGTVLAKPAELTLPIDPTPLGHFEGKPETCKVWVRSGEAWTRVDALRHTELSITIAITTFETAAAGVIFSVPTKTCTGCVPLNLTPSEPACDALPSSVEYCIIDLPQPSITKGLDEFATLVTSGRKVYWVAIIDNKPTVLRYDLDNPGPVFQYPILNATADGTIAARGMVAVQPGSDNVVWAGIAAFGNVRFSANADAEAFDRPTSTVQPAGVAPVTGFPRFRRVRIDTEKFDVRLTLENGTDKFVYNGKRFFVRSNGAIDVPPPEQVRASNLDGLAPSADRFPIVSTMRGLGMAFRTTGLAFDTGFWGIEFEQGLREAGNTVPLTNLAVGTEAYTMSPRGYASGDDNIRVNRWFSKNAPPVEIGNEQERLTMPNAITVRDLDYRIPNELFVVASGRLELYVFSQAGGVKTIALPDDGELSPWRIVSVKGKTADDTARDMLLVSRGPLTKKGRFSLIRKK